MTFSTVRADTEDRTKAPAFSDPAVETAFAAFPEDLRPTLLSLRALIFEVARTTQGVGPLEETLKWGQPSYYPAQTGSGTPLRLGVAKTGRPALYTHCQTRVVADFQALFPDTFVYEGTRGVHLRNRAEITGKPLSLFIQSALTYRMKER